MKRLMFVIFVALLTLAMTVILIFNIIRPDVDPAFESIVNSSTIKNGMTDTMNQFGVQGAEDIMFKNDGDYLIVYYGKQDFKFHKDAMTEDLENKLRMLGIEVDTNKKGEYELKWNGEDLKEVAN